jgi:DNA replication protein DnaC
MNKVSVSEPPHLAGDLKLLGLPAIGESWGRLAAEAARKRQSHPEYLADLVHLEVTQRRERRIQRWISEARFPVLKTLDGFDFAAQPGLDRDVVLELAQCGFVEEKSNIVLLGPVGTGKTHLAIALGMACCQRERRVLFTTTAELCNTLIEAKQGARLSRKIDSLARYDVLILDELGYVPFDKVGADLLFGLITKVYERKSLIITTNLPFARWTEVFLDATAAAAVIDRIAHHVAILKTEGESHRLREARRAGHKSRAKAAGQGA